MVCWVPGALSLGCSFTTLSAAHREMHSRLQPQEQVTNHRLFTLMAEPPLGKLSHRCRPQAPDLRPFFERGVYHHQL